MLLDKSKMLYELSLVPGRDLTLVLKLLCEQNSFFYRTDCIQASCTN